MMIYEVYTLTGHFIRYTIQELGWTTFSLQNSVNSLCHKFNNVSNTFIRDFGSCGPDSMMQLLENFETCIRDGNLFLHMLEMFY